MKYTFFVAVFFLCISPTISTAQEKILNYDIHATLGAGTGNTTAFWAVSNKYGTTSPKPNFGIVQTKIFTDFDSSKTKWDYALGLDVLNRFDGNYDLFFHQYYAKLRYSFLTLQAGRIEENFGNQDPELSSGGLLWSKNAPPMPKVTAGILDYTSVPFTKNFLQIKGAISHGWFEKEAYVKELWLHHKYIYIQAGGKLPVKAHVGFHHFAQWGGVDPIIGRLPSSLKDFKTIFLVKQYDSAQIPFGTPLEPEFSNRIGNHLGSRNFGLDVDLKPIHLSFYYQTIFEDASGLKWHNKADGLWGIALRFKKLKYMSSIVYEYIHTDDQSMSFEPDAKRFEPDNYFYHGIYLDGWTYKDYTLGTPLITSPILTGTNSIINNRVIAHHFGIDGKVLNSSYKLLVTYTKNKGTYFDKIPWQKESVSSYFEIRKNLRKLTNIEVSAAIATDFGKMYTNKSSFLITLRKNGKLF